MRTAQMKVALRSFDRDVLDWVAGALGERPSTFAARLSQERMAALLRDPEVRMQWKLHQQGTGLLLDAHVSALERTAAALVLRDALAVEERSR